MVLLHSANNDKLQKAAGGLNPPALTKTDFLLHDANKRFFTKNIYGDSVIFSENDFVQMVEGNNTDLVFKVVGQCIKFDEVEQKAGVFIIIEPINADKFIERFNCPDLKDIEPSDIELLVEPNEIKKWDVITCV